jgi:hypothetical protein
MLELGVLLEMEIILTIERVCYILLHITSVLTPIP